MSKQLFKADITYETYMGVMESDTLYLMFNCTCDYTFLVDKKGQPVECEGSDAYIDMIKRVLDLEDYDGHDGSVKVTELGVGDELPPAVSEHFYGPRNRN